MKYFFWNIHLKYNNRTKTPQILNPLKQETSKAPTWCCRGQKFKWEKSDVWWAGPTGLWCVGLDAGIPKFRDFLSHWSPEAVRRHPWEEFPLPRPCFCLLGPMGPSTSSVYRWSILHPPAASPQCHFRGWETLSSPFPRQHRVQHQLHSMWNTHLLNPEITADLSRGEIPAWKMRTSLGAERMDKETKSGYFPSCTTLAVWFCMSRFKFLHINFFKKGERDSPHSCATV